MANGCPMPWRYKRFTVSLAGAGGTTDVATAVGGDVVIDPLASTVYVSAAGAGGLTSASLVTNQTTVYTLMSAAEGAVANLTAMNTIPYAATAPFLLVSGSKLQSVTVGGAGSTGTLIVEIAWRAAGSPGGSI
jgi:hypothetical protein